MSFKITARTILHLGAELISSDAIAFYELIKNAIDAKSRRVVINVVTRLPHEVIADASRASNRRPEEIAPSIAVVRAPLLAAVISSAPEASDFRTSLTRARSIPELVDLAEEANYITFEDTGEGMSLDDLETVYLTIGTRARREERDAQRRAVEAGHAASARPVLGEKGVGRLSAMRLGRRLHVRTTKSGEARWNLLDIDWTWFSHDSDQLLSEVSVEPTRGEPKSDKSASGTVVRVAGLNAEWSATKLEDIARTEFSKLTDPFLPKALYPISLRFNGDAIPIRRLSDEIFDQAHATLECHFSLEDGPRLSTKMDYRRFKRTSTVVDDGAHLLSAAKVSSPRVLTSLGPFSMRLFWFNRRILTAVEGIGDVRRVREAIAQWSGGLMIYRDGFRVYPYGSPDDDWMDLDRIALSSGGYKVNRTQIVGKVDISAIRNPQLTDQTNREGLRDCPEADALKHILQHVLTQQFKPFLEAVDKEQENPARLTFSEIEARVIEQEEAIQENIEELVRQVPALRTNPALLANLRKAAAAIRDVMNQATSLAKSIEKGRTQLVHLAGLGLMVEIVAHELNRATGNTLATVSDARQHKAGVSLDDILPSLEAQLKTLQKRLRILDPLTTAGRQMKEAFDVTELVRDVMAAHASQFRRHHVQPKFKVLPDESATLRVKMVRGMVVQVLENLIANSVYWLKQQRRFDSSFEPILSVTVDTTAKEIRVRDNGPGVDPSRKEEIFDAFVTTKPPGQGKGLGLFISREIAAYHGASLRMSDRRFPHRDKLNTFIFSLEKP